MLAYRKEIDGLRALAVVSVILYHAGFSFLSGGFIGVDVFFVISGYLITSILTQYKVLNLESLTDFYLRRSRRILPALFFVMSCCAIAALVIMPPVDLLRFGHALLSVITFSSNFYFWHSTDYFAPNAEEHPLLHTWSLAVEEQFYLFFPLILIVFWKNRKLTFLSLTLLAIFSFSLCVALSSSHRLFSFYLLPTRAWELILGALIALHLPNTKSKPAPLFFYDFLSFLGLSLIIFSVIFFDKNTVHPGFYTIFPVMGTAFVIMFANPSTLVGNLLSSRILVHIGLLSYSAYLWHQPLFSFLKLFSLSTPSLLSYTCAIAVAFFLAHLTWHFIETPFRKNILKSNMRFLFNLAFWFILFLILGLFIHFNSGLTSRFSVIVQDTLSLPSGYIDDSLCNYSDQGTRSCSLNKSSHSAFKVALVGDSHASHLEKSLSFLLSKQGISGTSFTTNGCPFIPSIERHDSASYSLCKDSYIDITHNLKDFDLIIISSRWPLYLESTRFTNSYGSKELGENIHLTLNGVTVTNSEPSIFALAESLSLMSVDLLKSNKTVVYLYGLPEWGIHPHKHLLLNLIFSDTFSLPTLPTSDVLTRLDSSRKLFISLFNLVPEEHKNQVRIIDLSPLFCDDSVCRSFDQHNNLLYDDDDHLNFHGSSLLVNSLIRPMLIK